MQTESECHNGSNSWETGLATFELLWHYFAHGANSYMYWNMVLDQWGLSNWGWRQNSMISVPRETGEVRHNPDFFMMRHFSAAVRPGARYLPSIGFPGLRFAAFKNPEAGIVAVLGNPRERAMRVAAEIDSCPFALELPANSVSTLWFDQG